MNTRFFRIFICMTSFALIPLTYTMEGSPTNKLEKQKLKQLYPTLLILYLDGKHITSYSVSGLTEDKEYTDYMRLSKKNGFSELNAFSGTLTRIKKPHMYNNLNFEIPKPENIELNQVTVARYWRECQLMCTKQKNSKQKLSAI
jgi:hypothetical protein